MKATLLLRKDHERVRELFGKFRGARNGAQNGNRGVVEEIRREITTHSHIETQIFYPALRETSSGRAEELVQSALNDHDKIERLLADIPSNGTPDKGLETKLHRLIESVEAHINREEEELFAEARNALSEQRLEELGLEMEDRRRMFTQIAA